MLIELDFRSHVPIYSQIVEQVEQLVAGGVLRPGDQLPTVRQLAADLRVNFNTVARAYRMLDEAGLISTQQGRGTYVLEPMPEPNAYELRKKALEGMVQGMLQEAHRLGFDPQQVSEGVKTAIEEWQREGRPPQVEA